MTRKTVLAQIRYYDSLDNFIDANIVRMTPERAAWIQENAEQDGDLFILDCEVEGESGFRAYDFNDVTLDDGESRLRSMESGL